MIRVQYIVFKISVLSSNEITNMFARLVHNFELTSKFENEVTNLGHANKVRKRNDILGHNLCKES
jgi:hypothetical protein